MFNEHGIGFPTINEDLADAPEKVHQPTFEETAARVHAWIKEQEEDPTFVDKVRESDQPAKLLGQLLGIGLESLLKTYEDQEEDELYFQPTLETSFEGSDPLQADDFRQKTHNILSDLFKDYCDNFCRPLLGEERFDEEIRWEIYSATIEALTHNKLRITPHPTELSSPEDTTFTFTDTESASTTRQQVIASIQASKKTIVSAEQLNNIHLAIGELIANATKHGGGGSVHIHEGVDKLVIEVEDHGSGMPLESLPAMILLPGYSGTMSLGGGLKMLPECTDHVTIATSPEGTTVTLQYATTPQELGAQKNT